MNRSAHNSLNFDEPKTPAPNIMASWCVYEVHEEKWAKMLLPDAFMTATINLHSKACSVLASKWTRPEDYIKDKYSVRTVDVEYITNHESKPTKLVMLPPESEVNKFIKGNKAEACGFATTDSEINNKHLSRCLLCPPPDGRLRSGSYKMSTAALWVTLKAGFLQPTTNLIAQLKQCLALSQHSFPRMCSQGKLTRTTVCATAS